MTSRLKIYSLQDWCVADNYAVEGIAVYLAGLTPVYEDASFQYIRPALNTSIKISLPEGSTIKFTSHGGYVAIDENDETFYYYIMNVRYVAPRTVELELGLDTINTYWKDIKTQLTENDRHLIHRQHKDRFLDDTGARIIDRYPEDFQPALFPTTAPTKITHYNDNQDRDWYLVYKSENAQNDLSAVSCFAYCSPRAKYLEGATAATVTLNASDLLSNVWYYLIAEDDCATPGVSFNGNNWTVGSEDIAVIALRSVSGTFQIYARSAKGTTVHNATYASVNLINTRRLYYDANKTGASDWTVQYEEIKAMTSRPALSGTLGDQYVESLSVVDRTDPSIIKIIELPYAPFTPDFTAGLIELPTGWQYNAENQAFELTDLNNELLDVVETEAIFTQLRTATKLTSFNPNVNEARLGWTTESKLFNSQFYGIRFLYDATSWEWKPEFFEWFDTERNYPQLKISYKPSNEINSMNGFKFEMWGGDKYYDNADYPGFMIAERNNEKALYNSEYLNYLKYGKAYEEQQVANAMAKSWTNVGLGIAGGLVGAGLMTGTGAGAVIGAIIGAAGSVANMAINQKQQIESLQHKEYELQHQASSVMGNGSLNLFRWYSDNRLCWNLYKPTDQMRDLIYNYFYYFGYADNTYSAIDVDSRIWWNFIQADIVFVDQNMQQEFIEDIKARFRLGVTVMHKTANGYDWARDRENWEAKLFA